MKEENTHLDREHIKDLSPAAFIELTVNALKEQLTGECVMLGLSGGVDSTVTAVLLNRAIGQNLVCIFVDHGLLRKNEFETVLKDYKTLDLNVIGVGAAQRFYDALKDITDPEAKRKIIGKEFIDVFEEEAHKLQNIKWLGQGTIYPDILESLTADGKVIKSHHNVGGLPEKLNLKLIEPLKYLYKDEVRKVGAALGIAESFLQRHPFPGPGLGVRILGEITAERVRILQEADDIFISGLIENGLYGRVWQAGAILLPVQSVGVKNNERTYENAIILRAVHSVNAMTADWVQLPYNFLAKISNDIIYNVTGVNRVAYDISAKPPATIEWE
jgi:GMP synthase (glutamine-hydrolysing)